jgi:hypothetical protein
MDLQQQIADLRNQLADAMPQAIVDNDSQRKAQFIAQLEQIAAQSPESPGNSAPWAHLAALLQACVAILRGQNYNPSSLLPADLELIQTWQNLANTSPEQRATAQYQAQQQQIAQIRAELADAMPQAIADTDLQRKEEFILQLEQIAQQSATNEDNTPSWLSFVALLQACVAILHGQNYNPSSLLPEDLALVQAWHDWANATPEQRASFEHEQEIQQVAQFRAELAEAMPQAVLDSNGQRRAQYIEQLEQVVEESTDYAADSPWLALLAMLRACIALLRGHSYDSTTLSPEDLAQVQAWQSQSDAHIQENVEQYTQVSIQHIARLRAELERVMPEALASGELEEFEILAGHLERAYSQIPTIGLMAPLWTEFAAMLQASIAVLRGQRYDTSTLLPADAAQIQTWQAQASTTRSEAKQTIEQQRQQELTNLREGLNQSMPYAITDTDLERKEQYISYLEQMLNTASSNTEPDSPLHHFAAMLTAYIAVLRGQSYDPTTLLAEDLAQVQAWQGLADSALQQRETP